jgi:hypothetical protein
MMGRGERRERLRGGPRAGADRRPCGEGNGGASYLPTPSETMGRSRCRRAGGEQRGPPFRTRAVGRPSLRVSDPARRFGKMTDRLFFLLARHGPSEQKNDVRPRSFGSHRARVRPVRARTPCARAARSAAAGDDLRQDAPMQLREESMPLEAPLAGSADSSLESAEPSAFVAEGDYDYDLDDDEDDDDDDEDDEDDDDEEEEEEDDDEDDDDDLLLDDDDDE